MTSFRRPRPWLWSLAVTASLLLSLLPTIGRLHRALDADAALLLDVRAFCTVQGLVERPVDAVRDALSGIAHPAPGRVPAHDGDDCAYCPLLAATGLPAVVLPRVPPLPPLAATFAPRPQPALRDRHLLGWAPRGPPIGVA